VIITCEQCRTQFQLDDSRIPERGVRVRCSRCKHAFFVKPATEAGDPIERAVDQALAEDEEQRAGSIQELDPAAALRGEAEEESDWEFNDGSPDPEPDLAAAREVVDDLLGSVDEAPSEEGDDGPLSTDSDVEDDIDSLLESTGSSADLEALEPAAPVVEEPAAPAAEEDLGSPEGWDFFSDEQDGSLSEETDFERTAIGQIQLVSRSTLERPPIDVGAEPSKTGHRLRRLAHAAGWLSVALLVLGGLYGGLMTQRVGPLAMRTAQAVAGLEAVAVEGRWLDNAAAGPIYVISGELLRASSRPAVPGAWLAVRLFDENGVLLAEEAAVAGPALPEVRLREEDPRELQAEQVRGALAMAGAPLLPGDAWEFHAVLSNLEFHAVLSNLPEAASRFDLAAIPLEAPPPAPEAP
jgi:predicted Zn finger-like uncharacterized protein